MRTIDLEVPEDLPHRRGRRRRRARGQQAQSRAIQRDDAHPPAGTACRRALVPPRRAFDPSLGGGTHPACLCGPPAAPGGRGGQPDAHRQAQGHVPAGLAREHGRHAPGSHPVALSQPLPRRGGGTRDRNHRRADHACDEFRCRGRLRVRAFHGTGPGIAAGIRRAAGARDIKGDTQGIRPARPRALDADRVRAGLLLSQARGGMAGGRDARTGPGVCLVSGHDRLRCRRDRICGRAEIGPGGAARNAKHPPAPAAEALFAEPHAPRVERRAFTCPARPHVGFVQRSPNELQGAREAPHMQETTPDRRKQTVC